MEGWVTEHKPRPPWEGTEWELMVSCEKELGEKKICPAPTRKVAICPEETISGQVSDEGKTVADFLNLSCRSS